MKSQSVKHIISEMNACLAMEFMQSLIKVHYTCTLSIKHIDIK